MNAQLQAGTEPAGRPLRMFPTDGQRIDYICARALLDGLSPAKPSAEKHQHKHSPRKSKNAAQNAAIET
jgi:hypothetical protein